MKREYRTKIEQRRDELIAAKKNGQRWARTRGSNGKQLIDIRVAIAHPELCP